MSREASSRSASLVLLVEALLVPFGDDREALVVELLLALVEELPLLLPLVAEVLRRLASLCNGSPPSFAWTVRS